MKLVRVHEHPGNRGSCWNVQSAHPVGRCVRLRIGKGEVIAIYLPFTWSWYLFDAITGEDIGQVHSGPWNKIFEPMVIMEMSDSVNTCELMSA